MAVLPLQPYSQRPTAGIRRQTCSAREKLMVDPMVLASISKKLQTALSEKNVVAEVELDPRDFVSTAIVCEYV